TSRAAEWVPVASILIPTGPRVVAKLAGKEKGPLRREGRSVAYPHPADASRPSALSRQERVRLDPGAAIERDVLGLRLGGHGGLAAAGDVDGERLRLARLGGDGAGERARDRAVAGRVPGDVVWRQHRGVAGEVVHHLQLAAVHHP